MAKGYWIAHIDVRDAERYPDYVRLDTPVVARFGGRFLVRAGAYRAAEGPAKSRHVVVEFPDMAAAEACYRSEDYQEAAKIRQAASDSDIMMVEGLEGAEHPGAGGFWIVHIDVTDSEALAGYAAKAGPWLQGRGATYLVRGPVTAPETPQRAVAVLLAFDSYDAACAAYDHPDYAPLIAVRQAATTGELIIAEGMA